MILTGPEIKKQVEFGNIKIDPFSEENINPNSYNYHLSDRLLVVDSPIDCKFSTDAKEIRIPKEGIVLEPEKLYLGCTQEVIGSNQYVTSLIGRSSVGRLGMYLQITADLGQLGKSHQWTLEIHVVKKLRVYAGMKVGQVSFWVPQGDLVYDYSDLYNSQNVPLVSKINQEKFL